MPHSLFLTPAYLHYEQHLRYQTKPAFLFLHIRLFSPKIIIREKAAYHVSLEAGSKAIPPLIFFKVSCVIADTMKGNVEALVNNAGVYSGKESLDMNIIDVNIKGVVLGTSLGLERMAKHGGIIVALGSTASLLASTASPLYTASKHAVLGMIRAHDENSYKK